MTTVEKNLLGFITKHKIIIAFIVITIAALLARYPMLKVESWDWFLYLRPWFEKLQAGGGFPAIKDYTGDYNAPYVTILALLTYLPFGALKLIKLVSIAGDFLLAISAVLLVRELVSDRTKKAFVCLITYALVLFLPTVILNSSAWGQCDAIYTSFVLLALRQLIREKYPSSFIFLGIAFAFKLQAVFILPVFIILYFSKKQFSIFNFLWIPAMNVVLSLPAIIFGGWPVEKLITSYIGQANAQAELLYHFPSIFNFIPFSDASAVSAWGVLATVVIIGLTLVYILHIKVRWTKEQIMLLAFWCIITMAFFLPRMHERYLFSAEVIGLLIAIVYHKFIAAELVFLISATMNYGIYLTGADFTQYIFAIEALAYAGALTYVSTRTVKELNG